MKLFWSNFVSSNGGYHVWGGGWPYLNAFLLYYPPGSTNPPHYDVFTGRRHFRFNLRLWGEDTFITTGPVLLRIGPLVVFRSDFEHQVVASKRPRVLLSVGVVLPGGDHV